MRPSLGYENWLVVFPRGKSDGYFEVAEKNTDGTVTFWTRNLGSTGTLRPEIETKPVTRAKERERVDITKRSIQRGVELADIQYQIMKAGAR